MALGRRRFVAVAAALVAGARWVRAAQPVRIGTTAVILDDQVAFLNRWKRYLDSALGHEVGFVQRGSYREITDLLLSDRLDFAWVCGYPYVRNRQRMRLLAVPLYRGRPVYQSYLIVPADDAVTQSYADLAGKVFAYSDPDSNSGWLVPQYEMLRAGLDPLRLFRKTFYTWAHRKVVVAVATGLAQGGAVDGYVWETLELTAPELTRRTRVVRKSDEYGFPPLVARRSIGETTFAAMRAVLLDMRGNADGRRLLKVLNLDGFTVADQALFDGIAEVTGYVDARLRVASRAA